MILANLCKFLGTYNITSIEGRVGNQQSTSCSNIFRYQDNGNGSTACGTWLVVGEGDTPVSPNDIALAQPLSYVQDNSYASRPCSKLTWVGNGVIINSPYIIGRTATYANHTNEAVTVKEVGLNAWIYAGSPGRFSFLIARKVLAEPVVIEPGTAYTFHYEIKIPASE